MLKVPFRYDYSVLSFRQASTYLSAAIGKDFIRSASFRLEVLFKDSTTRGTGREEGNGAA